MSPRLRPVGRRLILAGVDAELTGQVVGGTGRGVLYSMHALGRDGLPPTVRAAGHTYHIRQFVKHDFFAATGFYDDVSTGEPVVIKFGRNTSFYGLPTAWIGRWLVRRETRFYERLADVPNVPRLIGRAGKSAFVHAFIPGKPLKKGEPVPDGFFDDLLTLVDRLAGRGIALVDTSKPENILLGEDGRPYVIDFQISYDTRALLNCWPARRGAAAVHPHRPVPRAQAQAADAARPVHRRRPGRRAAAALGDPLAPAAGPAILRGSPAVVRAFARYRPADARRVQIGRQRMNVLVAGGAGYIGSHTVKQLKAAGHRPVIYDNVGRGHREVVDILGVAAVFGELDDRGRLAATLRDYQIDVVINFAAYAYVGESVHRPLMYYHNNVCNVVSMLETMLECNVKRLVFSSTCATYGDPDRVPITEDEKKAPVSPYGRSKWMVEQILQDLSEADKEFKFAALRYFNASGCSADGAIGEDHDPETHLIPVILQSLLGVRDKITVFGTDYPTPDGTNVRDYIHVEDLADAHIKAMAALDAHRVIQCNLGTGRGIQRQGNHQSRRSRHRQNRARGVRPPPRWRRDRPLRRPRQSQSPARLGSEIQRPRVDHPDRLELVPTTPAWVREIGLGP